MSLQEKGRLSSVQRWALLAVLLVFGGLFASVSLVNHWNFRTSAMDLAYYNQAIYDYSQFRYNYYTLNEAPYVSTLGDHWEPVLMLVAPLRYLLGNETLLWVQIFALLWGGLGVFRFVQLKTDRPWIPHLAIMHFFGMWAAYSALSFDFHASVLGAMCVPWLFVWFERKMPIQAVLTYLLFVCCAEKMALWGFFIALGLAMMYWRDRKMRYTGLALGIFSIAAFFLIVKVLMPAHLKPGSTYRHINYSNLGESPGEIIFNIFRRPGYSISLFWTNIYPDLPEFNPAKTETWKMIALSGGVALLFRPRILFMFLPLVAINMFGQKTEAWTMDHHYSIEYMPLLSLGLFSVLATIRSSKWAYGLSAFAFVLCFASTLISFSTRYQLNYNYVRERNDLLQKKHWVRDEFEVREVREMLDLIPDRVKVSANSSLAPHLAMRDTLYMFPVVQDAEYVIAMQDFHTYPISKADTRKMIEEMVASGEWEKLAEKSSVAVLRRAKPNRE